MRGKVVCKFTAKHVYQVLILFWDPFLALFCGGFHIKSFDEFVEG